MAELHGATERFLIDDERAGWQPLAPGALDGIADIFSRLGDHAAIGRQPLGEGRGHVYTVTSARAGKLLVGQGCTVGDALRHLRGSA